ncbi:NADH-quinone oxidoreductase subunit K, partial [Microcystis aeruginosa NIES-298]
MNFALYGVRGIMQIQLEYYLLLAAALFCIGIYG